MVSPRFSKSRENPPRSAGFNILLSDNNLMSFYGNQETQRKSIKLADYERLRRNRSSRFVTLRKKRREDRLANSRRSSSANYTPAVRTALTQLPLLFRRLCGQNADDDMPLGQKRAGLVYLGEILGADGPVPIEELLAANLVAPLVGIISDNDLRGAPEYYLNACRCLTSLTSSQLELHCSHLVTHGGVAPLLFLIQNYDDLRVQIAAVDVIGNIASSSVSNRDHCVRSYSLRGLLAFLLSDNITPMAATRAIRALALHFTRVPRRATPSTPAVHSLPISAVEGIFASLLPFVVLGELKYADPLDCFRVHAAACEAWAAILLHPTYLSLVNEQDLSLRLEPLFHESIAQFDELVVAPEFKRLRKLASAKNEADKNEDAMDEDMDEDDMDEDAIMNEEDMGGEVYRDVVYQIVKIVGRLCSGSSKESEPVLRAGLPKWVRRTLFCSRRILDWELVSASLFAMSNLVLDVTSDQANALANVNILKETVDLLHSNPPLDVKVECCYIFRNFLHGAAPTDIFTLFSMSFLHPLIGFLRIDDPRILIPTLQVFMSFLDRGAELGTVSGARNPFRFALELGRGMAFIGALVEHEMPEVRGHARDLLEKHFDGASTDDNSLAGQILQDSTRIRNPELDERVVPEELEARVLGQTDTEVLRPKVRLLPTERTGDFVMADGVEMEDEGEMEDVDPFGGFQGDREDGMAFDGGMDVDGVTGFGDGPFGRPNPQFLGNAPYQAAPYQTGPGFQGGNPYQAAPGGWGGQGGAPPGGQVDGGFFDPDDTDVDMIQPDDYDF